MKHLLLGATAAISVLASLSAIAAESDTNTNQSQKPIPEIVVTANRVAAPVINSAQIEVLNRADIERSAAGNLAELLSTKAGFEFSQNGGSVSLSNLRIRGLNSKQILFLVNGQRFDDPTSGIAQYQLIPLAQIERIEIIKGSRSAIYGADAQGGVINIITRKDASGSSISATLGSNQTRQISVGSQVQQDNVTAYAGAVHESSAGYDFENDSSNDADGYERNGLNAGVSLALTDAQAINFDLQMSKGYYQYDSDFYYDQADYDSRSYTLGYVINTDIFNLKAQAGRNYDRRWSYGNIATRSNGEALTGSRIDSAEVTAIVNLSDHHSIISGTDLRTTNLTTRPIEYDEEFEQNKGALLAYRFDNDTIALEAGTRYDDNSNYGEFWSFNTNAQITFDNGDSLAFGQATAFRAPTFDDLYYPGFSNPELEVERSRTWTVDYHIPVILADQNGSITVSGQRAVFSNQIVYNNATFQSENIGHSYVNFASVEWQQDWSNQWRSELSQEWTEAVNTDTNEAILRIPVRATKANILWNINRFETHIAGIYRDQAKDVGFDSSFNSFTTDLPAYFLLNAGVNYQASDAFNVGVKVDNLTNKDYETAFGYPARGRYAEITGRYDF
ncbi:MAG: TonB-dependent receptor [Oleibacter sp.]|nr:TonB-dependent receptor [Thalassolituus sp.]